MAWLSRRPPVTQQVVEVAEVGLHALGADVLEHADAGDGVERAVVDLPVVLEADLDAVGQPVGLDAGPGPLGLGGRDGHAHHLHPVVSGGVAGHGTPPAAHVQQALAGTEAELAADQVVLGGLGLGQVGVRWVEQGARVGHGPAEHQLVEAVGDVVVVADRLGVAADGVQADAALRHLLRGRGQRPQILQVQQTGQLQQLGGREPGRGDALLQPEQLEDVAFDVDVTGDVGPGEAQLAGPR